MVEDRRSIEEIEAELARQRLALNANLAAVKERMTPGGIAREAVGLLNIPTPAAAGVIGSLGSTVRANPLGALLAGAGLVWLVARPSSRGKAKGVGAGASASSLGTAVSAAAALANVVAALEPDEIRAVTAEVDRLYRAGAAKVREIDETLHKTAGDLAGTLREGSRQASEIAAEKASRAREAAAEAKARIESGVEGLSEGAAAAAAAAGKGARRTGRKAKELADDAHSELAAFVERYPLASGAGAAATGVLIAALLGAARGKDSG